MEQNLILTDRQNRRLYLDIVKGVTIFLMLWGHCIQYCTYGEFDFFENPVFKFIYSFHMPLFMLVSGYLFFFSCKKRNLSQLLIRRTQALLQPIIMCSIFIYFITTALLETIYQKTLAFVLDGPWINQFGSLWFLWSVLASSLVVSIVEKTIFNTVIKVGLLCLGFLAMFLFPNCALNLYMYPYFVIGFFYAKYTEQIPKIIKNMKYVFLLIFPVMLLFFDKKHYIYTTGIISTDISESIKIDLYRWGIGLAGSVFMLVILELLCTLIFYKKPTFAKPLACLGVKSLQVYCVSVAALSFWLPKLYGYFCKKIGFNLLATNMILYSIVFTPIIAIIYAVLIYYSVLLLERIKVGKIIFGR